VNFKNTIMVMTSNIGTEYTLEDRDKKDITEKIQGALREHFRPEFLNRIDETIIFGTLSVEDVEKIVDLQMKEIRDRLREHGLFIDLSEAARRWLARQGYDINFGARPLRRALQRYVESPLSVKMLKGEFKVGDTIQVDANDEGMVFSKLEEPAQVEQVAA